MPFGMFVGLVAVVIYGAAARRSFCCGDYRRSIRHIALALALASGGVYFDIDFWHALAQRAGINMASPQ